MIFSLLIFVFLSGAKLGVMKKTLANEMLQRVWGRISFIIGRDHKIEA
jgi:hypothetical protein